MTVKNKMIHQLTVPTPFPVGDVHLYLLEGDMLTIVDAGVKTKEAWEALLVQLKEIGYTPADVEQVILTHHHPDHIGLVDQFPKVKGIYGHTNNDYWLTRDEAFFQRYQTFFEELYERSGVPDSYKKFLQTLRAPLKFAGEGKLSGCLVEGDFLPGHADWSVIETPGHAQSHLSFFRESDGVLLAGDHLLHHISSNPLLEPPIDPSNERPKPLLQYRDAMKKCLQYDITTVYPGHGPYFSDVRNLIDIRLEKQEQRAGKVLSFLKEGGLTAFQVCALLFQKQMDKEFGLTMSETIGQLDYLEDQQKIRKEIEYGVWKYYSM
ncbi:MBL fold metallo-hydrolase [Aquibacillus sp. 3ASR75-11]|uniref:MBL fold metallo-hydrolase n=1 Tax=Terrihalobacillus insolitus TaxID=2950438 RepID=A0A9X3WV21_9BACI|nr:MBL fold metallo-hydrolase [Terrihalobacillus insolitus]MDC3414473.1 MBL fold metallo-hydrolase [Terrihalobacillus insolitus]MDC3425353.1 MBL fold metallo-hydrolase [Terrihalobacillus insolitus]